MKKLMIHLAFAAALTMFLVACGGSTDSNDPKVVTKNFFEALKTGNTEEAAKYATKDSKSMLDLVKMGMSMSPINSDSLKAEMDKHNIQYSQPVINGDEATVTVSENDKEKTDIKLKKEDGQWKVAFDKNTVFKTGMEKMEQHGASDEEMKEAREAMEKMNSDSMMKMMEEAQKAMDSMRH